MSLHLGDVVLVHIVSPAAGRPRSDVASRGHAILHVVESANDVEALAMAALLSGRAAECNELLVRGHQQFLDAGDTHAAARCAIFLGFKLSLDGEFAQGGGWLSRARRLLMDQPECVEHGYLLLADGLQSVMHGEIAAAAELFQRAAATGHRFGDKDLTARAFMGHGRALIRVGRLAEGVALLDESMIAVTAGEVSPLTAGSVYCSVIESCRETLDLRRADEWTSALSAWCESQPNIALFRGTCLLHRAEVMQLRGRWQDALNEALRACERIAPPEPKLLAGAAQYRAAELHRLRGEFSEAEEGYRKASEHGYAPQPGLALLRLAQGRVDAAWAAVRGAASEVREPVSRAPVLAALAEVALATGDVAAAAAAAGELSQISDRHGAQLLRAMCGYASGSVLVAEKQCDKALSLLREAWKDWHQLDVPYEAARTSVLIAAACGALHDQDTCDLELLAARQAFASLGAAPDLARAEALLQHRAPGNNTPLSVREIEVLKCLASGATNREIASALHISEKTVARHVSNIFTKLDLPSRSAATAYAFRKGLA